MRWRRRKDEAGAVDPDGGSGADGAPDAAVEAPEDPQAVAERAARVAAEAEAERVRTAALAREARRQQQGPLDATELSAEDAARARVDLGALRLPAVQGMELRLEMEEKTQRVIGAVVVVGPSTLQLQAFAAPRTEGIWEEVRAEIRGQVSRQGGAAEEVEGAFGPEVLARMPVRSEDGRTGHRPVRFAGVDGPRWFVRAVFGGRAAVDQDAYAQLGALLRGVVVDRGDEAMAPRDMLPLRLPPQDQARPAAQTAPDDGEDRADEDRADEDRADEDRADEDRDGGAPTPSKAGSGASGEDTDGLGPLDPFHRGPETTETR
ncbi:DUF3710 domain-containing protein [Pseudokineococcus basanitobsidens]|uniref:DUF3710 domain-containing protein n=1 Tax=Pseudokineococcus basanitobsidens TaxID=1926649 RepID=A0ABU8RHF5_9ACTN